MTRLMLGNRTVVYPVAVTRCPCIKMQPMCGFTQENSQGWYFDLHHMPPVCVGLKEQQTVVFVYCHTAPSLTRLTSLFSKRTFFTFRWIHKPLNGMSKYLMYLSLKVLYVSIYWIHSLASATSSSSRVELRADWTHSGIPNGPGQG